MTTKPEQKVTPYQDGIADGEEFERENDDRAAIEKALADPVKADEGLINSMGIRWIANRWGIDWESQGREACRDYNRGFDDALRAALQ